MAKLVGNVLIAQGGGPTAVINQSLVGAVLESRKFPEVDRVYGALHGVRGIIEEDFIALTQATTHSLVRVACTPSSALLSTRDKPDADYCEKIFKVCMRHNVRYFFYNGGNDSMDTAFKTLQAAAAAGWEMRVIGVPKTIDNDLPFTDHSPGFGSAAKYIAATVRETGIDLESVSTKNKVTIMECMGRDAGWLTAAAALSRRYDDEAPHLIYLPEVPFSKRKFLADVETVYQQLGYCFVAVSEGITDEKGEYCFTTGARDAFGHVQLSGVGIALKDLVEAELGIKARCNTLGTCQRAAMHFASKTDADEAYLVGQTAVRYSLADKNGVMVTLNRVSDLPYECVCGEIPLDRVANTEQRLPKEWINPERNYVTQDFLRYARPLIEGEVALPMAGGLPDYVRLDFNKGRL